MKVLVLLSLVAFCASVPTFYGQHLIVVEDGTITLRNTFGDRMDIMRRVTDPRKVDVVVRRHLIDPVTYHLDDMTKDLSEVTLRNILGSKYSTLEHLNQADTLFDVMRPYEGAVNEETYTRLLNKIQLLIEAGVLPETLIHLLRTMDVHGISDVTPLHEVGGIPRSNGIVGLNTMWPVQEDSRQVVPREWMLNQDMLNSWSPVQRLQTLLEQIKQKRQFQQGLLTGEYYPQENSFQHWTPELVFGQREESPIRDTMYHQFGNVYNRAHVQDIIPEHVTIVERLQQWIVEQELMDQKVDQFIEQGIAAHSTQKVIYHQRLLNQEVEEIIKQLVYKQSIIARQIEQMIKQRQIVVSQEVVAEQKIVFQLVQTLLAKLTEQQVFINDRIQRLFALGTTPEMEWFVQQKIVHQQIHELIQQLFVQQVYLRTQIQALVQEGVVFPQELFVFQKMTYHQVENFIQVLIKQFVNQQVYFKHLIQLSVQHGQTIPQELVSQYTMIYEELVHLIKLGDFVPQELITEHERIHSQILLLLEHKQISSEETVNQWGVEHVPYEWVPQGLRNQWVSHQGHMLFQQPEFIRQREMFAY